MTKPEKIVFILSTSRTGTKTLAKGLAGDNICSPHQPKHSRLLTIASNYYLHGWLSRKTLKYLVENLRESQILESNCQNYIQVFSLDYMPAKIISEKNSNVYIVHIIRDPRTFVRSYLNWMHSKYKSFIANKFILGWHPSGFFTGEMTRKEWRQMNEFQRVCWHWTYKNSLLENLFLDNKNYVQVKFEDLFLAQDTKKIESTLSFLSIPYQQRFNAMIQNSKNASRKEYFPAWEEWNTEQKQQMQDICGDKMKEYEYGNEKKWLSEIEIKK